MEENYLKLEIEKEEMSFTVQIQLPINKSKLEEALKPFVKNKKEKFRFLKVSWNDTEIEAENYFGEFITIDEIKKGSIELEKDLLSIENIDKDELLDFMLDYVDEGNSNYLIEDYLENEIEDEILYSYSAGELWDYLDWNTKEEIIYDYIDNTSGWHEIYSENTNNSEIMKCLFQNTSFSPKEMIEKIQNGDTEDETE